MKKKDYESDRPRSPSFCSNRDCCCGCVDTDCSRCEETDESRSSTPDPQDRAKRDSSSREVARSPIKKGSSNTFSTDKSQKTKNSLNSSTKPFKDDTTKWIEKSKKYSSPTMEIEKNKHSRLSTKAEKEAKLKVPIEKKEKVDKKRKSSSKEMAKEKLMPQLLALDKKVTKTFRKSPEVEYDSSGSDLESDYYVERESPKKVKKNDESDKRGAKKIKRKLGEDFDRIRFTKEEDMEIISFIEKNVDMPQLHKHMMDTFPDRKRAACSFHGRRESLFKKFKKAAF